MNETVRVKNIGLRGVTVADTKVSFIDGEKGVLIYRGYRIEELAQHSSFMETAYLLLKGILPDQKSWKLSAGRSSRPGKFPASSSKAFRSGREKPTPWMFFKRPCRCWPWPTRTYSRDQGGQCRKAIRLIARFAGIVAAWHRVRSGLEPFRPMIICPMPPIFCGSFKGKGRMMKSPMIWTPVWSCTRTTPSMLPPSPAGRWFQPRRICMRGWPPAWELFPEVYMAGPMPRS